MSRAIGSRETQSNQAAARQSAPHSEGDAARSASAPDKGKRSDEPSASGPTTSSDDGSDAPVDDAPAPHDHDQAANKSDADRREPTEPARDDQDAPDGDDSAQILPPEQAGTTSAVANAAAPRVDATNGASPDGATPAANHKPVTDAAESAAKPPSRTDAAPTARARDVGEPTTTDRQTGQPAGGDARPVRLEPARPAEAPRTDDTKTPRAEADGGASRFINDDARADSNGRRGSTVVSDRAARAETTGGSTARAGAAGEVNSNIDPRQPASGRSSDDDGSARQHQPSNSQSNQNAAGRSARSIEVGGSGRTNAATARAAQVDAAIRLEQATGQPATAELTAASTTPRAPGGATIASVLIGEDAGGSSQLASADSRATSDSATTGRVVRGLTAMVNSRGGTMTMRLDPPELGQLRVQMTLARGTVSAQFTATSEQARALLERNLGVLRTTLESQGLTVERLNVQLQPSNLAQHAFDDASGREAHRQDAGDGRSRGRADQESNGHQNGRDRAIFEHFLGDENPRERSDTTVGDPWSGPPDDESADRTQDQGAS